MKKALKIYFIVTGLIFFLSLPLRWLFDSKLIAIENLILLGLSYYALQYTYESWERCAEKLWLHLFPSLIVVVCVLFIIYAMITRNNNITQERFWIVVYFFFVVLRFNKKKEVLVDNEEADGA